MCEQTKQVFGAHGGTGGCYMVRLPHERDCLADLLHLLWTLDWIERGGDGTKLGERTLHDLALSTCHSASSSSPAGRPYRISLLPCSAGKGWLADHPDICRGGHLAAKQRRDVRSANKTPPGRQVYTFDRPAHCAIVTVGGGGTVRLLPSACRRFTYLRFAFNPVCTLAELDFHPPPRTCHVQLAY